MRRYWIAAGALLLTACSTEGEPITMAEIRECPSSPNCASSVATDEGHRVAPLSYRGSGEEALVRLKAVVSAMPRTELVGEEEGYLHYVVTTRLIRFKDDMEFGLADEEGRIDVRSASRVGHSDMGVNRKRIEEIRKAFEG